MRVALPFRYRIKHNVPIKEVADAAILMLRATKARTNGYVQFVRMAGPELYLTLQVKYHNLGCNSGLLLHWVL